MNSIKRQLSFTETNNDVIKKNRKITYFEDLSNELFYEIFDYLDGSNIYNVFSKLNIRFENLLIDSLFPLKINFSFKSRVSLEDYCRQLIIPNKHRIISLHFKNDSLIKAFYKSSIIDSSFNCLESVTLRQISMDTILMVLSYLKSLSRLSSLKIHVKKDEYRSIKSNDKLVDLYKHILCLPYLKYNEVSLYKLTEFFIPMNINEKPNSIERLNINFACTVNELTSILFHTPYLRHLFCRELWNSMKRDKNIAQLKLLHLTHISIGTNTSSLNFNDFKIFIKNISCQLRTLSLKTRTPEYFDANQWEQLIKDHMPCLSTFNLEYSTGHDVFSTPTHEEINQFISSFWIERIWLFKLEYRLHEVTYFIYSYRKKWFDDYIYDEIVPRTNTNISKHVTNFSDSLISPIQLRINAECIFLQDLFFIKLARRYSAVGFTHLSIDCKEFYLDSLITVIELLPDFHTLEVSSRLITFHYHHFRPERSEKILSVSSINKITKVKLKKNFEYEMKEIDVLMSLCSRMEYFEVECTTEKDLKMIVRCITMKSNTCISNLKCLCLCIAKADENMIENLRMMIDCETRSSINQFFNNYTLRRRQNKIFLNRQLS